MADRLQRYADWLIANQNKKGTPEFDTVANSYKQLRGANPAPAPQVPQSRDGAFAYGVDKGQELFGKGIEVAGRLVGSDTIADFGTDIVKQQQEDIAKGGYQPSYAGSLRENYQKGTFLPALGEKVLENLPQMGFALGGTAATAAAAYFGAPAWAVIGGGATVGIGSSLLGAGESAQEQEEKTGSYDARVSAGVGVIIGILDKFGAGKVIPANQIANMSAQEIIDTLAQKGFTEAATEITKRTMKAAVAEGATETAQDAAVISGAKTQGAEYTAQEIGDRAIDSFALGGVMGGGTRAGAEIVKGGAPDTPTREAAAQRLTELGEVINPVMVGNDPQAAADLARKLEGIAEANGMNLKDVAKTSTKGAREVIDKAHIQYAEDLKRLANDLRDQLRITDNDELSVVLDKVLAIAGQREARNKTKSTVGVQEMEAIQRLAGNTKEGQEMLSLMRQMNELTTLHNEGYVAGLSKFTDQLSPFPSNVGYSDRSLIETPTRILGTLYGASVNPLIPAAQTAAVIGGRAVDAITGRRSRVARYIKDNKRNQGINVQGDYSVREQRRAEAQAITQAAEEDKIAAQQMHQEIFSQNGRFSDLSPQQIVLDATGLSPQNAVAALEELAQNPTYERAARAAINSIKNGGRIPNMPYVIAGLDNLLNSDQTTLKRDRQPDPQAVDRQPANTPADVSAGYIRGIQDNRAANDALIEAVNADESISPSDKATLIQALANLRSNLGSNPVDRAFDIASQAERNLEDPTLADKYIMPYVTRVMSQQPAQEDAVSEDKGINPIPFTNNPMRISPRRPTAVNATEDPLGEVPLQIGSEAILGSALGEKLMPKVMDYLGVRGERQLGDNRSDEQIFIDHIKNNLLALYNSVSPEYRERAKQWYVGANKLSQEAADKYGLTLAQVAGVMASLSPQKDWYMNYDLGIRTIDSYSKIQPTDEFTKAMATAFRRMIKKQNPAPRKVLNATLKAINGKQFQDLNTYEKAVFIRFWDAVNNPERGHRIITPEGDLADFQRTVKGEKSGTAWNGFGDIEKAISIIENGARDNIDIQLGMMHKVRSFYNNILDPMSDQGDVTIDTHAVAAGHLRPFSGNHKEVMENFKMGGKSAITGAVGAYGLYADAYRAAAAEVGILPREMQSITWEAVRGLFTPSFKGQQKNQDSIADVWKRYDAGDITIDQARQEIFDEAGGINRAAWEGTRPDNSAIEENRSITNTGNLSGSGLPGANNGRGTGSEPARPLLRTAEGIDANFDIADLTPLDMNEPSAVAADLIARITAMQPTTGVDSGLLKFVNKTLPKAVKLLDPEGREVASLVQVGLENMRLTNQEIEKVLPHLIDAFNTLTSDENTVVAGSYGHPLYKGGQRDINIVGLDQRISSGFMDGDRWLRTFFHELGHAIERQSGLREAFNAFKYRSIAKDSNYSDAEKARAKFIYDEAIRLSRERRSSSWIMLDQNVQNWRDNVPAHVPSTRELADMTRDEYLALVSEHAEILNAMGLNSVPFQMQLGRLKEQLDYMHGSGELAADALARYMEVPSYMRKEFPELSAAIREVVNNSDIAKFITFHTVAGLVGAGGMTALLMTALDDDDENRGILTPGRGALSAA